MEATGPAAYRCWPFQCSPRVVSSGKSAVREATDGQRPRRRPRALTPVERSWYGSGPGWHRAPSRPRRWPSSPPNSPPGRAAAPETAVSLRDHAPALAGASRRRREGSSPSHVHRPCSSRSRRSAHRAALPRRSPDGWRDYHANQENRTALGTTPPAIRAQDASDSVIAGVQLGQGQPMGARLPGGLTYTKLLDKSDLRVFAGACSDSPGRFDLVHPQSRPDPALVECGAGVDVSGAGVGAREREGDALAPDDVVVCRRY
jgi:hypothetical protein